MIESRYRNAIHKSTKTTNNPEAHLSAPLGLSGLRFSNRIAGKYGFSRRIGQFPELVFFRLIGSQGVNEIINVNHQNIRNYFELKLNIYMNLISRINNGTLIVFNPNFTRLWHSNSWFANNRNIVPVLNVNDSTKTLLHFWAPPKPDSRLYHNTSIIFGSDPGIRMEKIQKTSAGKIVHELKDSVPFFFWQFGEFKRLTKKKDMAVPSDAMIWREAPERYLPETNYLSIANYSPAANYLPMIHNVPSVNYLPMVTNKDVLSKLFSNKSLVISRRGANPQIFREVATSARRGIMDKENDRALRTATPLVHGIWWKVATLAQRGIMNKDNDRSLITAAPSVISSWGANPELAWKVTTPPQRGMIDKDNHQTLKTTPRMRAPGSKSSIEINNTHEDMVYRYTGKSSVDLINYADALAIKNQNPVKKQSILRVNQLTPIAGTPKNAISKIAPFKTLVFNRLVPETPVLETKDFEAPTVETRTGETIVFLENKQPARARDVLEVMEFQLLRNRYVKNAPARVREITGRYLLNPESNSSLKIRARTLELSQMPIISRKVIQPNPDETDNLFQRPEPVFPIIHDRNSITQNRAWRSPNIIGNIANNGQELILKKSVRPREEKSVESKVEQKVIVNEEKMIADQIFESPASYPVKGKMGPEIDSLAEQVYKILEKRIAVEKDRRGMR